MEFASGLPVKKSIKRNHTKCDNLLLSELGILKTLLIINRR